MTLHDPGVVDVWDLGANFYLSESDIGKSRAAACADKLQELNAAVLVSAHSSEITDSFLSQFQVYVYLFGF